MSVATPVKEPKKWDWANLKPVESPTASEKIETAPASTSLLLPPPTVMSPPVAAPVSTPVAMPVEKAPTVIIPISGTKKCQLPLISTNLPKMTYSSEDHKIKKYEYNDNNECIALGIHLTQDEKVPVVVIKQTRSCVDCNAFCMRGIEPKKSQLLFTEPSHESQIRELIAEVKRAFDLYGHTATSHVEFMESAKLFHHSTKNPHHTFLKIPFAVYRAAMNHLIDPKHPPPESMFNAAKKPIAPPPALIIPPTTTTTSAVKRPAAEAATSVPKKAKIIMSSEDESDRNEDDDGEEDSSSEDEELAFATQASKKILQDNPMTLLSMGNSFKPMELPSATSMYTGPVQVPNTLAFPVGAVSNGGLLSLFNLKTTRVFTSKTAQLGYYTSMIAKALQESCKDEVSVYGLAGEMAATLLS